MSKKSLKEVSIVITKGTTPTTVGGEFKSSGIKFIKSECISNSKYLDSSLFSFIDSNTNEKLKRSKIKENDLLFSIAGAYLGKIAIARGVDLPANTNQAVGIVRLNSYEVDVNYLYYYFSQKSINEYINKLSSQSSQPNLNLDLLGKLEFDNKPLITQQKIATVLSALDDKIELNNKINTELEGMAKTLYGYWFVQFDFSNTEGKPYKSSGGKMVYNETLKREIPEGWAVERFGDVFNVSRGTVITKETSTKGNYKVVAAGLNYSYLTGDYNRDEFTITISGSGANAGYVNFWTEKIFASDCTTVRGNTDFETFVGLQFLNHYQKYIFSLAKGSAQPHVYPSDIEGLKFISMPNILIEKYGVLANDIYSKIAINLKQNQELTELRDWLLPMLMNGQVKVGNYL